MENPIIYIILIVLLIASSLILQVEVFDNLNMTSWNFTGSGYLTSLISNMPLIFLVVCVGVIAVSIGGKMNE